MGMHREKINHLPTLSPISSTPSCRPVRRAAAKRAPPTKNDAINANPATPHTMYLTPVMLADRSFEGKTSNPIQKVITNCKSSVLPSLIALANLPTGSFQYCEAFFSTAVSTAPPGCFITELSTQRVCFILSAIVPGDCSSTFRGGSLPSAESPRHFW